MKGIVLREDQENGRRSWKRGALPKMDLCPMRMPPSEVFKGKPGGTLFLPYSFLNQHLLPCSLWWGLDSLTLGEEMQPHILQVLMLFFKF